MKDRVLKRLAVAGAAVVALFGCSFDTNGLRVPAVQSATVASVAGNDLPAPPEVVSHNGVVTFQLSAAINSTNNLPAFLYEGVYVAPTIRVKPGDTIVVYMDDELPPGMGMGSDMNLHFHGLSVSPMAPSDDVLTMLAKPGQSLYYRVVIPKTQPPGLYWYHPHVHGVTNYQVGEGGMSGAIIVEGIESHIPALKKMRQHVLIVRQLGSNGGELKPAPRKVVKVPNVPCAPLPPGAYLTVNSRLRPTIRINPGEPEFFRVINATGHHHLDLKLDGMKMQIVEVDGYPIDAFPGAPVSFTQNHIVVPPAGRVEFVAIGTASSEIRSLCYNSGPVGDPDPEEVLVHLRPDRGSRVAAAVPAKALAPLVAGASLPPAIASLPIPPPAASREVRFTENLDGFYINGRAYSPSEKPVFVVHTGTVERWTVVNLTPEVHDFHLHQVHFEVEKIDGVPVAHPLWRDTAVVPHATRQPDGSWKPGKITLLADFRSPNIRGTFLFHCHILDHEDLGMMAKIQAI